MAAAAAAALLLLLALCALGATPAAASPDGDLASLQQERMQRQRISSFFRMGENPLAWDSDVLNELHMKADGPTAKEVYTRAGNLAAYFGLQPVTALHLPVPLNIIFVGFSGEGNLGIHFTEDELRRWFEHLDHVLQHTRVDLEGKGPREGEAPLRSLVRYNFTCHVVGVGRRVSETIGRAIRIHSRPNDPEHASGTTWQVDATKFEELIDSFLESLGLHHQYNLLVLNPLWDPARPRYGYRTGFSAQEMRLLARDPRRVLENVDVTPRPPAAPAKGWGGAGGTAEHHDHPARADGKFRWIDMEYESEGWVDRVTHDLDKAEVEAHKAEKSAAPKPPSTGDAAQKDPEPLGTIGARARHEAAAMASKGTQEEAAYVHQVLDGAAPGSVFPQEACLTDAYVGRGRYAWLDLTAGPFEWGPVVGGAGVRTNDTLPKAAKHFGDPDAEDGAGEGEGAIGGDNLSGGKSGGRGVVVRDHQELETELEDMAESRFAEIGDQDGDSAAMLAAELDVYEMFAQKHCHGRDRHIALCDDIRGRVGELEEELKTAEAETPAEDRKHHRVREHKWNIFGDDEVVATASLKRDVFLAEVGAVISGAMRHVVAPATASGSYKYSPRVSFLLYIIGERSVPLPPRPGAGVGFDVEAFKSEVLSLALPSQRFTFHTTRLATAEDPALALAYASALRTAVMPTVRADGIFATSQRVYLDSSALQHQLWHSVVGKDKEAARGGGPDFGGLEVPIFVFLTDEDHPVFIDQHYLGRSLPDMVLAVQSTHHHAQETHMTCNGQLIKWDLASPLKAVVAATVQHLAGVLPSHVGTHPATSFRPPPPPPPMHAGGPRPPAAHSEKLGEDVVEPDQHPRAHHPGAQPADPAAAVGASTTVAQDWMWSVGAHPLSHTTPGHHLSLIQRDAVHRAHLINALDESAGEVNAAVAALAAEETTADTWGALQSLPGGKGLAKEHANVLEIWDKIVAAARLLEWDEAAGHLADLDKQTRKFVQLAEGVADSMHPLRCTLRRQVRLGLVPTMGLLIVVAGSAVACLLLRGPRHNKPKIN